MGSQANTKSPFEFTGEHLCLDFANTVNDRPTDHPTELLASYLDVLRWGKEAGVLNQRTADRLSRLAAEPPGRAQSALRHAIRLRDTIYEIFLAVVERRDVPGTALAVLNTAIGDAAGHARIAHGNRRFTWEWVQPEEHLESLLWPLARAASELLVSEEIQYVRACPSETCSWLFLDKTKNHRRRWCDMRTCGNRDKARRYYQRQRVR
jgi:predicted RNA-binding Zn ribbon-like protein